MPKDSDPLERWLEAIDEAFSWLEQMYPSDTSANNSPDLDEDDDDDELGAPWDPMWDYDLDGDDGGDDDEEDDWGV